MNTFLMIFYENYKYFQYIIYIQIYLQKVSGAYSELRTGLKCTSCIKKREGQRNGEKDQKTQRA